MTRFSYDTLAMTTSGKPSCFWEAAAAGLLAVSLSVATARVALAEDNQTPPAAAGAAQPAPEKAAPPATGPSLPPQPPPADKRGFLNEFGRWWEESAANFNAKMKDARQKFDDLNKKQAESAKEAAAATQEAMKNAAEATKNAATAVVRLPNTRVIEVHEACAAAANGAPDCQVAATKACRGKGFETGQPLDVRTADKCPASLWISGQAPAPGQCSVETVVLRAVCQ
jgi:hypothetical protein